MYTIGQLTIPSDEVQKYDEITMKWGLLSWLKHAGYTVLRYQLEVVLGGM